MFHTSAGVEAQIQTAIRIKPENMRLGHASYYFKVTADDHFAIRLQGEGENPAPWQGAGIESCVQAAIGVEAGDAVTRQSIHRCKTSTDDDFAIELDPLIANFSMMTPYPGTKVYEIVKSQGRLLIEDWEDYVFFEQKARYEMGEMTAELVEEMYRRAYRQFYLGEKMHFARWTNRDVPAWVRGSI